MISKFKFKHITITLLQRNGKCIICGKEIKAKDEYVVRFKPHITSIHREVSICFNCLDSLNHVKKEAINNGVKL